jgi:secondary thiamine-phosphate synthase enzyme
MMTIEVITQSRNEMVNITDLVQSAVGDLGLIDGHITLYAPHTTCGLTITENADPDVGGDMMMQLDAVVPWSQSHYKHRGGNSAAHIKSSLVGCSLSMLVEGGELKLGVWQGVFLCEFDGPRTRHVWVG